MMKYHNHRQEPYFTFLKNGTKTIEGRLRKGKYLKIQPGDLIKVNNDTETDSVKVTVKRIAYYASFKEMLTVEPLNKVLPDIDAIEKGIDVYRKYYSLEDEHRFGVVAIEVEKVNIK